MERFSENRGTPAGKGVSSEINLLLKSAAADLSGMSSFKRFPHAYSIWK